MSVPADNSPPIINDIQFTTDGASSFVARGGTTVTLGFTVIDQRELAVGSPPPSFSVTIGPPGSAAPVFSFANSQNLQNGPASRYSYTWRVPDNPSFTRFGYSISVTDFVGNIDTVSADDLISIGTRSELRVVFVCPACDGRRTCL